MRWRDQPKARMPPAKESLHSDNLPAWQLDLWLIFEEKVRRSEAPAAAHPPLTAGMMHPPAWPARKAPTDSVPASLAAYIAGLTAAQHFVSVSIAKIRVKTYAYACRHVDGVVLHMVGSRDRLQEKLRAEFYVGDPELIRDEHDEFISSNPSHSVGVAHFLHKASRREREDLIAYLMSPVSR